MFFINSLLEIQSFSALITPFIVNFIPFSHCESKILVKNSGQMIVSLNDTDLLAFKEGRILFAF